MRRRCMLACACRAPCNPPGSPFIPAVPWVVRGEDALVLVCDGCGRGVVESPCPSGLEVR